MSIFDGFYSPSFEKGTAKIAAKIWELLRRNNRFSYLMQEASHRYREEGKDLFPKEKIISDRFSLVLYSFCLSWASAVNGESHCDSNVLNDMNGTRTQKLPNYVKLREGRIPRVNQMMRWCDLPTAFKTEFVELLENWRVDSAAYEAADVRGFHSSLQKEILTQMEFAFGCSDVQIAMEVTNHHQMSNLSEDLEEPWADITYNDGLHFPDFRLDERIIRLDEITQMSENFDYFGIYREFYWDYHSIQRKCDDVFGEFGLSIREISPLGIGPSDRKRLKSKFEKFLKKISTSLDISNSPSFLGSDTEWDRYLVSEWAMEKVAVRENALILASNVYRSEFVEKIDDARMDIDYLYEICSKKKSSIPDDLIQTHNSYGSHITNSRQVFSCQSPSSWVSGIYPKIPKVYDYQSSKDDLLSNLEDS